MAQDDDFCVKLESFECSVKTSWQELQTDTDFCDVTLACEGKQIKTHKIIISSYSPVLRNILKLNQNPLIYLCKVKYKDLVNMLHYMYQGEVNVAKEDLSSFLEFAEALEINGISVGTMEDTLLTLNNFKTETIIQPTIQHVKRKRTAQSIHEQKETTETINDISKIDSSTEILQETESDSNVSTEEKFADAKKTIKMQQPIERNTDISNKSEEIKTEVLKFETIKHEDNGQSFVSTVWKQVLTCAKCEKQFLREQALKAHNKSIHEGIWEYCNLCDYKAMTMSILKCHVQGVHEGIQYSCNHCDYRSTKKYTLKRHVQAIHEGVRYPCNQCDYTSKWKNDFNVHMKKIHQQYNTHS